MKLEWAKTILKIEKEIGQSHLPKNTTFFLRFPLETRKADKGQSRSRKDIFPSEPSILREEVPQIRLTMAWIHTTDSLYRRQQGTPNPQQKLELR